MKKKIISVVLAVFVVLGGVWYLTHRGSVVSQTAGYIDGTYRIEGQSVTLVNGHAESSTAPGSATKVVTQYFGNEATGDLNGDGVPDIAFILTQNTGGSGTFFYVVAAVKTTTGYAGTDAMLIGDRIAPQTTEITDGKLIVNYADRAVGESFAVPPSQGKSLVLKLDPTTLLFGIVAPNFEGEADPARMTLGMQTWTWGSTLYNNDKKVVPAKPKAFTLTFKNDGSFAATTDCNGIGGAYTVTGSRITFSKMVSTLMYCDGSQEDVFKNMLQETQTYLFTSKGELVLGLTLDSGSFIFR